MHTEDITNWICQQQQSFRETTKLYWVKLVAYKRYNTFAYYLDFTLQRLTSTYFYPKRISYVRLQYCLLHKSFFDFPSLLLLGEATLSLLQQHRMKDTDLLIMFSDKGCWVRKRYQGAEMFSNSIQIVYEPLIFSDVPLIDNKHTEADFVLHTCVTSALK